ncbi:MAG TPA: hypothetical protein VEY10_16945, partial [Flavisolibacter sp.]|nr:hypothetical protein [Flavisolibacter sp.]
LQVRLFVVQFAQIANLSFQQHKKRTSPKSVSVSSGLWMLSISGGLHVYSWLWFTGSHAPRNACI